MSRYNLSIRRVAERCRIKPFEQLDTFKYVIAPL